MPAPATPVLRGIAFGVKETTMKTWCRHLGLAAALTLLAATNPARADEVITLTFSQFLGPKSFFQVDVVDPWARELEARTGGRVKVETFDGSSPLGAIAEQATNVRTGKVDIALGLRGAEGNRFPGTSLIELPFMSPDAARGSAALWGLYRDGLLAEEFRDYQVLALFVQNPGIVHTSERPVRVPGDLKGLRLRSPGATISEALTALDAVPVVLQFNEVLPAFEAGRIDGILTNWGNPLPRFNEIMKFHTDVQLYSAAFFIVMNKNRYATLPADIRAAIDAQSGETWVRKFGDYWNRWDAPVLAGAKGPGHEIIVPDAAQQLQWREALRPVADRYIQALAAGGFPQARKVHDNLSDRLK